MLPDGINDLALMTDIESMDVTPEAAIVTIGAVMFDPRGYDTEESIRNDKSRCFYAKASLQDNQAEGRSFSADTIQWWLQQSPEAQASLFEGHIGTLRKMLTQYNLFIDSLGVRPTRFWANDPDFDMVIIGNAMRQLKMMPTWKFWETRSVRTVKDIAYPEGNHPQIGVGTAHDALDDSIRQALTVQHCMHVIEGRVERAA